MDGIEDSVPDIPDAANEAIAREAALRKILQVISNNRDDEGPVFQAILRLAQRLCGAPGATLLMANEARTELSLVAAISTRTTNIGETHSLDTEHTPSVAVRTGAPFQIVDVRETELYRSGDPVRTQMVDESGLRTSLAVPLMRGDEAIGAIVVLRFDEPKPFSESDIDLLEAFAAQAVIAIENVRQFRELQTRLEREKASAEILEVISRSRDDATPVFDVLLRAAQRLCNASNGAIVLGEEGGGAQILAAQTGASEETLARYASGRFPMDPHESLAARAIAERKTLHFEDVAKSAPYRDGMKPVRMLVEKEGIRSSIYVPLISNGRGIGCLNLLHKEQRTYSPDEIALVESFAAQAVIAIENTRQFRELQTRLEREAATSEILSVISRSRDDEQPVFDVILRKASKLCNSTSAGLVLGREGDKGQTLAAHLNSHPEIPAIYADGKYPMDPEVSSAAKAIIEGRVIHLKDMKDSDAYRENHLQTRRMVDHHGVRTNLLVPLLSSEGGIGALILFKQEVSPYTDDEIALVEAFAAQAVIAIENVRQFRELQMRLERERASAEILEVISQSRNDEQPVFDIILTNAARMCDAASATLLLVTDDRSAIELVARQGHETLNTSIGDLWPMTIGLTPTDAVRTNSVVQVEDLRDTDLYRQGDPTRVSLVDEAGLRTSLAVPLRRGDQAVGAIVLHRIETPRPFAPDEISLVEGFAAQAVIAIENVRQFKALASKTEEVQALNASLEERVEAQVGEIERMGRLKRFLPAAVADTVVSSGSDKMLSSHRALLGVLFCDMRGFTAFCETAEPEETIEVLQTYHQEMGRLINAHGAGVDHRMGDGIMVLFNDPLPCDDPAGEAVRLALAMRDSMEELCRKWKRLGHRLGFGVGISLGYATVGMVGYEGRYDYTASGTAVNIAARLCDHAEDGEILLSPRAWTAVEDRIATTGRGEVAFKGINREIEVRCIEPGAVLEE